MKKEKAPIIFDKTYRALVKTKNLLYINIKVRTISETAKSKEFFRVFKSEITEIFGNNKTLF